MLIDLQAAQHGHIDVSAANEAERHRAVERRCTRQRGYRPPGRIGQKALPHTFLGNRAGADQAILGLEKNVEARREVIRDLRRNADAEIDQHSVAKLLCDALGNNGLCIHGNPAFTRE